MRIVVLGDTAFNADLIVSIRPAMRTVRSSPGGKSPVEYDSERIVGQVYVTTVSIGGSCGASWPVSITFEDALRKWQDALGDGRAPRDGVHR